MRPSTLTEERIVHSYRKRAFLIGSLAAAACHRAFAQPAGAALMLTVPFPAGGAGDISVRIVSQRLQERFGLTSVVENRPGANGMIGVQHIIRSKPDGNSLVMATPGMLSIAPFLNKAITFDVQRDLTPISGLTVQPLFLAVSASAGLRSVRELLALGKRGAKVSYGSSGIGAMSHLLGSMLSKAGGGTFVHVPYKGGAPLLTGLIGGDIQFAFLAASDAVRYDKEGRVALLGVTGKERSPLAPQVPTMWEAGIDGIEHQLWLGLLGPAGIPKETVARLQRQIHEILAEPQTREKFAQQSMLPWPVGSDAFAATLRSEADSYRRIIEESGLKAE
ncbi:MAG: hypothetical protein ABT05_06630 [Lautropia sp. SCN 66-9]|nr:MAG: hypothetical protein ABT05_06630 [Lautropia sp. SCN 66-9]